MTCSNCGGTALVQDWTPQKWSNKPLVVYHGTLEVNVQSILRKVQVSAGSPLKDFGKGFYTTTVIQQAITWAHEKVIRTRSASAKPAVLELRIDRNKLAKLSSLYFVRGHFNAEEYWSFIWHCRTPGNPEHHLYRPGKTPPDMYDVVAGPINAMWKQRIATYDGDQISFHTLKAENLLNDQLHTSIKQVS